MHIFPAGSKPSVLDGLSYMASKRNTTDSFSVQRTGKRLGICDEPASLFRKKMSVSGGGDMELHRGGGTILVVDDEPLVAELAGDILRRFGFGVLTAGAGEDAVSLYQQKSQEIVAVVLDIVMPGMDGKEVFQRLRTINPKVKVVVSSGYSHDRDADTLLEQGAAGFVQKPYRIAELIRVVNATVGVRDKIKGKG